MMFDYLGVRLNGPRAAGRKITLNVDFTQLKKQYVLTVENGVLNYGSAPIPNADASLKLTKATMNQIQLGKLKLNDGIDQNRVTLEGNRQSRTTRLIRQAGKRTG